MTQNNLIFEPDGKVEEEYIDRSVILAKEVVVAQSVKSVLYAHQINIGSAQYCWLYAGEIKIRGDCLCSRVIGERVEVCGSVRGGQVVGAKMVEIEGAGNCARMTCIEVGGESLKRIIVELDGRLKQLEKEIKKAEFWQRIMDQRSLQLPKLISEFELFANYRRVLATALPTSLVIHNQLQPPLRLSIKDYELTIEEPLAGGISLILEDNQVKVSKMPSPRRSLARAIQWRLLPRRVRVGTKACDLSVGDVIKIDRICDGNLWQLTEEMAKVTNIKNLYNGKLHLQLSLKDIVGECIIASNIKVKKVTKSAYQRT